MSERPRRRAAWNVLLAAGLLLVAGAAALWLRPSSASERIVLIVVDTLRRDHVSAYGGDAAATPHIDALAERGQLFTRATASFHQTSMSMSSLFTGRTPSIELDRPERPLFWNSHTWCGLRRFADSAEPGECIPATLPTLAQRLREAGYRTIAVASNQFLYEPSGFGRGFDEWIEVGEQPPGVGPLARITLAQPADSRRWERVNRAAIGALNERPTDRFFLYVHYMDVHDYAHGVDASDAPALRQSYARSVEAVDRAIGRLLAQLDSVGLLEGAAVVVTADHGERLGERHAPRGHPGHLGNPTFQEHLEVPLVVAPASGRDPAAFLRTQDLFPLLLELAGLPAEPDGELAEDEVFLSELEYRTYQRGRFKTAVRRSDGSAVLFDLEADPGETRDAAEAHPDALRDHLRRIEELSESLAAARPAPAGLSEEDRARLRSLGYLDED